MVRKCLRLLIGWKGGIPASAVKVRMSYFWTIRDQRARNCLRHTTHKHTQNKHVSRCCSTTKLAQYSDRNVYFIFLLYSILFNFLYLILSYFILFCFILCYIISFNLSYFIFFLHFILQFHGVVGTQKKNWNGHPVRYTVVFRVLLN